MFNYLRFSFFAQQPPSPSFPSVIWTGLNDDESTMTTDRHSCNNTLGNTWRRGREGDLQRDEFAVEVEEWESSRAPHWDIGATDTRLMKSNDKHDKELEFVSVIQRWKQTNLTRKLPGKSSQRPSSIEEDRRVAASPNTRRFSVETLLFQVAREF